MSNNTNNNHNKREVRTSDKKYTNERGRRVSTPSKPTPKPSTSKKGDKK